MTRGRTLVAAALLVAAPLRAQITNGGFETPVVPVGSFTTYGTGDTFTGWTVVGAPGSVAIVSTSYFDSGFSAQAHSGAQWFDLTGFSNSATGIEQAVTTVVGTTYDLSFWVGSVYNPGGPFGSSSTVNPFVDGVALAAATTNGTAGTSNQTWQQFTRTFTATSTSTTIRFLNGDPGNDTDNALDDVTLSVAATATPEPATLALLVTGLATLGAIARRRRSA